MLRRLLTITFSILFIPVFLLAQSSITGTVIDESTGETIAGANIFIQSLQRGTTTDVDGEYTISNIEPGTYTLRVSFIGYRTLNQDVQVSSGETIANFELQPDLIGLEDVVVTAQQIEREERELGYTVTSVGGDELNKVAETNMVNSLSGKIPGVEVSGQSGTVGGSTRITIRGNSTLTGNTQPLFVVDGVPIYNSNIIQNTSSASRLSGGAVDVGNRGADISADDIESISVLKGGAAAALYGQRAQNGVVLITTKKGQQGGTSVSLNSTVRFSSPLRLPDYQNQYAQGDLGEFDATDLDSWGPRIEGQTVTDWRGNEVELQAYENNIENFFRNGLELINSVSIAGGDEDGDFRLGVSQIDQEGTIPESVLDRVSINLNAGQQLTPKLRARVSANYVYAESHNRPVQGGNDPNALMETILSLPRNISVDSLRNNIRDPNTGDQISLTNFDNNPFFIINENGFDNDLERLFGTATVTYSPVDWIDVTARVGNDFYTENRLRVNAVGTLGRDDGGFFTDKIQERQINSDIMVDFDRQLTDDFSIRGILGHNINVRSQQIISNNSTTLAVEDLLNFSNAQSNAPTNNYQEQRLVGVYGETTVGYQDYLFLTLTARNDWSSTLPKDNNSFFYPSANLSFIFTQGLNINSDILSYGKLRANIAEVGSDEAPYQLAFRYFPDDEAFGQYGTAIQFPFGDRLAFDATNTIPPLDLKPQRQVSWEVGTELQFFGGRLGVDFTYYNSETRDQIISIPQPISTGFSASRTNVGTVANQGIEALISVTPVRNRSLQWNTTFNFAKNVQEVVALAPGVDDITIDSGFNGLRVKAVPGDELGLYGAGWARNENDQILIDESTGLRIPGDEIRLGDMAPDWTLGINNSFSFLGFDLSFLIDIKQGGTIVSGTIQDLRATGSVEETLAFREEGSEFIDDGGVIDNGDGTYRENDVPVENIQAYWENLHQGSIWEESAFDASYVKLREVKFGYTLPRRWLRTTPIRSASISVVGRNVWLIWAEAPHIDPESNVFGSGVIGQGVEFNNIPNSRSIGTNVSISF